MSTFGANILVFSPTTQDSQLYLDPSADVGLHKSEEEIHNYLRIVYPYYSDLQKSKEKY